MTETATAKRKRRSNAEILEALKAERLADKEKKKQETARAKKERAAQRYAERKQAASKPNQETSDESIPVLKVYRIDFKRHIRILGRDWEAGESIELVEGTPFYALAHDRVGNFIFNKTPEEQLTRWGVVKYEVNEETINGSNDTQS